MGVVHRNPTEESFILWVSNHPESFHPLDMERFYCFAHNVSTYHSKRWLDKTFFAKQIKLHQPNFKQENIDLFFERLLICTDYSNTNYMPLIDADGNPWHEIRVLNHKIVYSNIEDVEKYLIKRRCKKTSASPPKI